MDQVLIKIAEQGKTIVMTSHDLARTADLASRFDVISRGVISASGMAADINASNLLTFYKDAVNGS